MRTGGASTTSGRVGCDAPEHRADPLDELLVLERPRHVVVAPAPERSMQSTRPASLAAEHDHRRALDPPVDVRRRRPRARGRRARRAPRRAGSRPRGSSRSSKPRVSGSASARSSAALMRTTLATAAERGQSSIGTILRRHPQAGLAAERRPVDVRAGRSGRRPRAARRRAPPRARSRAPRRRAGRARAGRSSRRCRSGSSRSGRR